MSPPPPPIIDLKQDVTFPCYFGHAFYMSGYDFQKFRPILETHLITNVLASKLLKCTQSVALI